MASREKYDVDADGNEPSTAPPGEGSKPPSFCHVKLDGGSRESKPEHLYRPGSDDQKNKSMVI